VIRLLLDGVAFQRGGAAATKWRAVLGELILLPQLATTLLDRGNVPALAGVPRLPFPQYLARDTAADSVLIQQVCDLLKADVFLSTGATSPVATPAVAMGPTEAEWHAEEVAIAFAFAQRYVCTSEHGHAQIKVACPAVPAHCLVHSSADAAAIASAIQRQAQQLVSEARAGKYDEFLKEWSRIRRLQAAVDWAAVS
jgi:hypothetical protein